MKKWSVALITLIVLAVLAAPAMAQLSQDAVQQALQAAVTAGGPFPAGTAINSVAVNGTAVTVDLNGAVITPGFGDAQSDDIVAALNAALDEFGYSSLEVTVDGKVISDYLPASTAPATASDASDGPSMASQSVAAASLPIIDPTGSELAGKKIGLAPSHGLYQSNNGVWYYQRTFTGPGDGHGTYGLPYVWEKYCEDWETTEVIRYLKYYMEMAGAQVFIPREMDPDAGYHPTAAYGGAPVPWMYISARDYLKYNNYPSWIWDEPSLTANSDKDVRARPYFANYYNVDCQIALHSNAAGSGNATGTETFWYTQASNPTYKKNNTARFATEIETGVCRAIREYFDDSTGTTLYGTRKPGYSSTPYVPYNSSYPWYASWRARVGGTTYAPFPPYQPKNSNYGEIRETNMVSALTELAFHDDWYYFPDNLYLRDQQFQSVAMWGMYEGVCKFFGITPRPKFNYLAMGDDLPAVVKPGTAFTSNIALKNLGMAWVSAKRYDAPSNSIQPWVIYKLATVGADPFAGSAMVGIAEDDQVLPGQVKSFAVNMVAPAADGIYTTSWQMVKDDNRGASGAYGTTSAAQTTKPFGPVISKTIIVDGTAPAISISSPVAKDYEDTATFKAEFSASDELSGVASVSATLDGAPIANGAEIDPMKVALGEHHLVVSATDVAGNTTSTEVVFNTVDLTAPVITIAAPIDGAKVLHTDAIAASFSATDNHSGVASISATLDGAEVENGAAIDAMTLSLGTHTLTVTAKDVSGNEATSKASFTVIATLDSQSKAVDAFYAKGKIDNDGIYASLLAKLAQDAKAAGDAQSAREIQQSFINEIEAQSGKHIAADAANWLLNDAKAIQAAL